MFLPVITPREGAAELRAATDQGLNTGLLFGGERAGLETQDIALCQAIITIPIDPRFRSLNLAQAVAINAYEWRLLTTDRPPPAFREGPPLADQAMVQGLYDHLEGDLDEAGFFHPPEKKPSMVRNLRAIFARSGLNEQEVRTLRGVVTAIALSRATMRTIKQNLFWAFAYNVLGIPLAALGYLSPVLSGAAMALSSVSVVGNALLLKRWRP